MHKDRLSALRTLVGSDATTAPTRAALLARWDAPPVTVPRFLDLAAFDTLRAVCARLLPSDLAVDVAGPMDARLADGESDGWRYDALPPDRDTLCLGLAGLDQAAQALYGVAFLLLVETEQDAVLQAVQRGDAPGEAWTTLPAPRFFEELLAEATEVYYAHPLASAAIGYGGMADAPGWAAIGLDERDARELPLL